MDLFFWGWVRDYNAQKPKNHRGCAENKEFSTTGAEQGGIWFQPWSGSWWHCCAVANTSQQGIAVLVGSPQRESPAPPEILAHNKDLTDGWRGKTHILSGPKTFTALTISKATSACCYNILTGVFFWLIIHHIISSHEWTSPVSMKMVEGTGSSPCSWLSPDSFWIPNRWRSHIQRLTKAPTSTLSSLG